eukprot:m.35742 g.35742  ORF g.35742 m.35742 type:complete len:466 (-) comp7472_c0_seq1:212-1609(-)
MSLLPSSRIPERRQVHRSRREVQVTLQATRAHTHTHTRPCRSDENVSHRLMVLADATCDATVVILGHGLSDSTIKTLSDKSAAHPDGVASLFTFDMEFMHSLVRNWVVGEEATTRVEANRWVFQTASPGSVNAFSNGMITPKLVLAALQKRDKFAIENSLKPTRVELIVDACRSGAWVDFFEEQLKKNQLKTVTFVLQSVCGTEEMSFYQGFAPALACAQVLADGGLDDLTSKRLHEDWTNVQTPQLLLCQPSSAPIRITEGIHRLDGKTAFISGWTALSALSVHGTGTVPRTPNLPFPIADPTTFTLSGTRFKTDGSGGAMALYIVDFGVGAVVDPWSVHVHCNSADGNDVGAVTFEPLKRVQPGPDAKFIFKSNLKSKKNPQGLDKYHYDVATTVADAWDKSKDLAVKLWTHALAERKIAPDDGAAVSSISWNETTFYPNPLVCARDMIPRSFVWDAHYQHLV